KSPRKGCGVPDTDRVTMNMTMNAKVIQKSFILLLLACLVVPLVCVVYPLYVIRPFRAQGPSELAAALVLMRFRTLITLVCAIVAVMALVQYWRILTTGWKRVLACAGAAFVCLLAILARVNVYELMFHPVERPGFGLASQMKLDK